MNGWVLPDDETRRLTDDPRLKYNLAFTRDGVTYTVSVVAGDSHLLLSKVAGLT